MNYIKNFSKEMIDKINTIESQKIKDSLFSIMFKLIQIQEEVKKSKAEIGDKLTISISKFLERYNYRVKKISRRTFQKRIDKLTELGILKIEKGIFSANPKQNSYIFISKIYKSEEEVYDKVYSEVYSKVYGEKNTGSIDIPNTVDFLELHKYKQEGINNNILYINKVNEDNFDNFGDKIKSEEEAINITVRVLKELKIKRKFVKNATLEKIKRIYRKIDIKGAIEYIKRIIIEYINLDEQMYKKAVIRANYYANKKTIKPLRFQNYDQRPVDYDAIEEELLAWPED